MSRLSPSGPRLGEAVLVLVSLVVLELGVSLALPAPRSRVGALVLTGAFRLAETVLCLGYWRARGWTLGDLGLVGHRARTGFAAGVAFALGFALLVGLAEGTLRLWGGWSLLAQIAGALPRRGPELALLLAVGVLVGPLFEEMAFRGVLYGGLRRRLGPLAATAAVTTVFAAAHAVTSPVPWVQAVGGILFCAAYEVSGSLWAPLIVHASGNLAIFLLPLWIG